MDDHEIIALYNSRNPKAIDETHLKYGKLCYGIADGILHCKEDNEESINDTYMTAWKSIPPANPKHFSAYLCGIVRNVSLKRYEHKHAQKRDEKLNVPLEELENIVSDRSYDILHEIESRELGESLNSFLHTLPLEERNIFIRRYWFFHKTRQIARDFSCSESKIKSILFRTRNKLRVYLEKNYFQEEKKDV